MKEAAHPLSTQGTLIPSTPISFPFIHLARPRPEIPALQTPSFRPAEQNPRFSIHRVQVPAMHTNLCLSDGNLGRSPGSRGLDLPVHRG